MTINNRRTPSVPSSGTPRSLEFFTFCGLRQVATPPGAVPALEQLVRKDLETAQYGAFVYADGTRHRKSVRILDTFLTGSFEHLWNVFIDALRLKLPVRILVLNPFGKFAASRAEILKRPDDIDATFYHANEGLRVLIRKVLDAASAEGHSLSYDEVRRTVAGNGWRDIKMKLEHLREWSTALDLDLQVRFYDLQTEAPVFLLGRYVAKGLLLSAEGQGAVKGPWLVFVDDVNVDNDVYDTFDAIFQDIWDHKSKDALDSDLWKLFCDERKVFIVHGRDRGLIRYQVLASLTASGVEADLLQDQNTESLTLAEKLESSAARRAIVLLTPDDVGKLAEESEQDLESRVRQNVLLELGFFWGRAGRSSLFLLKTADLVLPSDMGGIETVTYEQDGDWKHKLTQWLARAGVSEIPRSLHSAARV